MDILDKQIFSTIVYYDTLEYPLTLLETWKYLMRHLEEKNGEKKISLGKIFERLNSKEANFFLENYQGFYFLKGRNNLVAQRIAREKISQRKIQLVKKLVSKLKFSPFVRMIAITGRVAMKNSTPKSDLDLMVVIEKGKIFTGRFFFTVLVHLLGKRRYGKKIRNRACLNYFITNDSLEVIYKDIFSSSEYFFILPIFGKKTFQKFYEKNRWIEKYRTHYYFFQVLESLWITDSFFSRYFKKTAEFFFGFDWLEKKMKNIQMQKIKKNPKTYQKGSEVIANEKMLVFLPQPQGPKIYELYEKNKKRLNIS